MDRGEMVFRLVDDVNLFVVPRKAAIEPTCQLKKYIIGRNQRTCCALTKLD